MFWVIATTVAILCGIIVTAMLWLDLTASTRHRKTLGKIDKNFVEWEDEFKEDS